MSSPSSPDVDSFTETLTQWGLILSSLIYGAHLILSGLGLKQVLERKQKKLLAYLVLLFCFATAGFGLQAWWTQVAFIRNRNYPGGSTQFLLDNVNSPPNRAVTAVYLVLNWLSDGIILQRFYVLYSCGSGNPILALAFVVPSSIALCVTGILCFPSITGLGVNLWSDMTATPGIAYMALSLSINTALTFLIICRLLYLRRKLNRVFEHHSSGQRDFYTSMAAMLIESATLYTVVALMTVVACAMSSPMQYVLLPMLGQLQAIPSLLTISRLATGSALSRRIFYPVLHSRLRHKQSSTFSDATSVHSSATPQRGTFATKPPLPLLLTGIHVHREIEVVSDRQQTPSTSTCSSSCHLPHLGWCAEVTESYESYRSPDIEKQVTFPDPVAVVNR